MPETTTETKQNLIEQTTDIVAAYVSNNPLPSSDLPKLIADIHAAISGLANGAAAPAESKPVPAVPIKKSVTPDYLISLEDGKKFKSLKRHLATHHNMTPDQYRQKWNLPADYPMVAPNYSAARAALARASGLGRKTAPEQAKPAPTPRRKKLGLKFDS